MIWWKHSLPKYSLFKIKQSPLFQIVGQGKVPTNKEPVNSILREIPLVKNTLWIEPVQASFTGHKRDLRLLLLPR